MILYLDTSALVKLYVVEPHSNKVRGWAEEAEIVATCRIAYPEALSAMNRRFRQKDMTDKEYKIMVSRFTEDWDHFAVIDFDEIEAGRIVKSYGLRAFDAVHISAAKLLNSNSDGIALSFSSFDEKLNAAARVEGFSVLTS